MSSRRAEPDLNATQQAQAPALVKRGSEATQFKLGNRAAAQHLVYSERLPSGLEDLPQQLARFMARQLSDEGEEPDDISARRRSLLDTRAFVVERNIRKLAHTLEQTFSEKWRERARAVDPNIGDSQRAQDAAIHTRLSNLLISGERFGARLIGRITEDDWEAAFAQLTHLAASSWNKYRNFVRMLQTWGVDKGYLARPWVRERVIKHRSEKGDKRERRLVADVLDEKGKLKTPGEEKRLLEQATPWLQRLIIAALETGCRRGELLALQWRDVDLSRGVLTIRAENAKSGRSRRIPVSQRLRGVLAMIDKDPKGKEHPPTAFVFGDAIGRQVKDPKKAWATCCNAAGVVGLHFHDLRHEAGSRMLEAGWPLSHVQQVLGHADAATTSRYLNASLEHLIDSMKRFGIQPLQVMQSSNSETPPEQAVTADSGELTVN